MKTRLEEIKNNVKSSIHIVLDIDGTLALRKLDPSNTTINFYRNSFNIDDILEYRINVDKFENYVFCVLHPGARAFIQFISQIPKVKLSFFSSATEEINISFVKKLLDKSLGNKHHFPVTIFSRPYCANNKKDISKIIGKTTSLKRVILIDDNEFVVCPDQRKNALITRGPACLRKVDNQNFFDVNHIFYIVGLLAEALKSGYENFLDLIQKNKEKFKWPYYLQGLAELKKFDPELYFYIGNRPRTLSAVTQIGCAYLVEDLLNCGEEIESADDNQNTALHIAAQNGYSEVLTLLLDNKANKEARNIEKNTPLIIAAKFDHLKIANILLERNAAINAQNICDETALFYAFTQHNVKLISALFKESPYYNTLKKTQNQNELLKVVDNWMRSINNKIDVLILYKYLKKTEPLAKQQNVIKKIAQTRILELQKLESDQGKNLKVERHIKVFLKTSKIPFFKNPLLDNYLMLQKNIKKKRNRD